MLNIAGNTVLLLMDTIVELTAAQRSGMAEDDTFCPHYTAIILLQGYFEASFEGTLSI